MSRSRPLYVRLGLSGYERQAIKSTEQRRVEERGLEYRLTPAYLEDDVVRAASGARVVAVNSKVPLSERVIGNLPGLALVIVSSSGYEKVDVGALVKRGIRVARLADVRRDEVVEHTLAMVLTLLRRLPSLSRATAEGRWLRGHLEGLGLGALRDATVGIVGLGVIGCAASRVFSSMGCRLVGADPAISSVPNVEMLPISDLLAQADIVTAHVSLTRTSTGLFDEKAFDAMHSEAIFVNTSRGDVVVEEELFDALEKGSIGAAGLDVFVNEPPTWCESQKDDQMGQRVRALVDEGRLLLTPHGAGYSPAMPYNLVRDAMKTLDAFLADQPLPYELG